MTTAEQQGPTVAAGVLVDGEWAVLVDGVVTLRTRVGWLRPVAGRCMCDVCG